ncbi:SPFH domain-containing protein [Butyricicoccus sp.]|uniref:SPFH domain-containing protein n=1 Tax=Butyricicoccus sp. TaxID=2049021 RepID=UPI0037353034
MGLIKAAFGSAGGVLADQWKEYFYCDALETDVIAAKGQRRTSKRSSNKRGNENIITSGSVIAVADGQCMIIVEQGKVVDICAEPGEYTYDAATEPSVFCGDLSKNIPAVLKNIGKRFTFGGEAPMDQRIYYFNTKELIGNKYGTPSPVPFRVVDTNVGLDVDISIRCFGEYSYRVTNPVLFYTNVCGNVDGVYERSELDSQLKSELLTALQPAFARISEMGVRYSALPGHTAEIAAALNEILSAKWKDLRGIEIVSFGVSSVKASEEDEQMIKELQRNAAFRNPTMAAAHMVGAQAAAMQSAAANEGAGPAMAFMGMNMAQGAGGANAQQLFQMGQQVQPVPPQPASASASATAQAGGWTCACGHAGNTGKFCTECGAKKPDADGWTCPSCGTVNKGKFCSECGAKKPAGVPQYRCDKCGWEPEDPAHPPKFCPECGDPFDDGDIK